MVETRVTDHAQPMHLECWVDHIAVLFNVLTSSDVNCQGTYLSWVNTNVTGGVGLTIVLFEEFNCFLIRYLRDHIEILLHNRIPRITITGYL